MIWLEDDLELVVHLHPVWVLAVTRVIGTYGGLNVGHLPWLRAQDAQEGSRIHGSRPYLGVIRLPD